MTRHDPFREEEEIELWGVCALNLSADAPFREGLGLRVEKVADGVASVAGAFAPSAITMNRMPGLGRARPPQVADVQAVVDIYGGAGVEPSFVQPDPSTSGDWIAPLCAAAGLERARPWQKFTRGRHEAVPEVENEFAVREVVPVEGEAFARIVCDAFDLGSAAIPWIACQPDAVGWYEHIAQ